MKAQDVANRMRYFMQCVKVKCPVPNDMSIRVVWKNSDETQAEYHFLETETHLDDVNDILNKHGYVVTFQGQGSFRGLKDQDCFAVFLMTGRFPESELNEILTKGIKDPGYYRVPPTHYLS